MSDHIISKLKIESGVNTFDTACKEIMNPPEGVPIPSWERFTKFTGGLRMHEFTIFCGATGCLAGNSIIPINRNGVGKKITIQHLYESYQGFHSGKNFDKQTPTFVRSFNGINIQLHKIKDVFISGIKKTWRLNTDQTAGLRLTECHRVLTRRGWVPAIQLVEGDYIASDSGKSRSTGRQRKKLWDTYYTGVNHHPFATYANQERRIVIHRAIYEAHDNGLSLDEFLDICRNDPVKAKKLKFINPKVYHVHHKDHNHYNNEISNLEILSVDDHLKHHGNENNFNQGQIRWVKFLGLDLPGMEAVYDIECEDPHHNFIANGLVVHNSGKTQFLANLAVHLTKQGVKCLVAPVETGHTDFARRMLSVVAKRDLNTGEAFPQSAFMNALRTNQEIMSNVFFSTYDNRVDINEMVQSLSFMADKKGVKVAVLDNLNFFMKPTRSSETILEMDEAVHTFVMLAKKIPIHIFLVMHPRKTEGGKILSEFDIKGSSTAVQEASNILLMNKPTEDEIDYLANGMENLKGINKFCREFVFKKIRKRGFYVNETFYMRYDAGAYIEYEPERK
jgi:hypothetical protein